MDTGTSFITVVKIYSKCQATYDLVKIVTDFNHTIIKDLFS